MISGFSSQEPRPFVGNVPKPEEVFPLELPASPTGLTEAHYTELDVRLNHIFEAFQKEGKLVSVVNGNIEGTIYTKVLVQAQKEFPQITAAIFNNYLTFHRKLHILGYHPTPTTKVLRPKKTFNHPAPPSSPPTESFGHRAANDVDRHEESPELF